MKLLFIGALPPPVGGDAIWAKNYLAHPMMQCITVRSVNTSVIGTRANTLRSDYSIASEAWRSLLIWYNILASLLLFRPDVVHLNSNCSPFGVIRDWVSICLVRLFNSPIVFHCHANVADAIGKFKFGLYFLAKCLKFSDKVLVLNSSSMRFCGSIATVDTEIVPNFVNEENILDRKSISDNISNILFVGHLIRTKGVFEVFEVARTYPDICFTLAGVVTPEISRAAAPHNVVLVGNVDSQELTKLLRSSDIFLFPTHTEGFSMALLEAMSNGLPVITTSVGANPEMLEDSGGIFVPVNDVDALCGAINNIRCPSVRQRMSSWNIEKVCRSYTDKIIINKLMHIYRLLITS